MNADVVLPEWACSSKPLTVKQVSELTTFSEWYVLKLRKTGKIRAILDAKPYRFDPRHIYDVFFTNSSAKLETSEVKPVAVRSLKTGVKSKVIRRRREDLCLD